MRWIIVVAAIAPSISASAEPDTAKPTSLVDVLAVAVRAAPELQLASIDLAAARATWRRTLGIEDITLTAQGGYARNQYLSGSDTDYDNVSSGTLDLGRALPTGGSLHLTFGGTKTSTNILGYVPGTLTSVQVALTQPLLRGFGTWAARAPRYEAEHRMDAARADREARARALVEQIVAAYWQVALARAGLEVRKNSLALAEQQRTYTDNSIKIGKIPKSELLAVEENIAVRKQDVIAAELEITQASLELRRIAGLEIGADALDIATVALPAPDRDEIDLRSAVAAALEHSAALASAQDIERADQARLSGARSQLLPQLDLSVSGGPQGFGGGLSSSLTSLRDGDGYLVGVTVTSSYAFGRNDAHGQVDQSHAELLRAMVDTRTLKATIAADTARAVQQARAAREAVELGAQAIELASENVEAEQHRFEDRKSTNFDIILRQNELESAKLRHVAAIVDYLTARAELDALTGAILPKYGIKLDD
ncbi:MAG TPA: TolC family protein [Kofleriaceae bacterium]|nr:TolC family protein [Kofleriaceae bacterium]